MSRVMVAKYGRVGIELAAAEGIPSRLLEIQIRFAGLLIARSLLTLLLRTHLGGRPRPYISGLASPSTK